jgi:hypothetical protein
MRLRLSGGRVRRSAPGWLRLLAFRRGSAQAGSAMRAPIATAKAAGEAAAATRSRPRGAGTAGSHRRTKPAHARDARVAPPPREKADHTDLTWPPRDRAARDDRPAVSGGAALRAGDGAVRSGDAAVRIATRATPDSSAQAADAKLATAHSQSDVQTSDGEASDGQPWYAEAQTRVAVAGQRDCGVLENVLTREWPVGAEPVPEAVAAINRLAELPLLIKQKLAAGLDAIHVGAGGVPDLDHMTSLRGVPLPSGRATWDACAGAYGDRKIIIGSRPSPTPDVTCHEVGHALDDLDGSDGCWQSDSPDFQALYGRCQPHLASEFHQHGGLLGRREFFADAFAAIASSQRPALVEMLSGNTRAALDVMLYFNVRYGV